MTTTSTARADAIASPGGFYLWGQDEQRDQIRRQALREWHRTDDDEHMYAAGIWARPEPEERPSS